MTQEEKQLFIKVLCSGLPYETKVEVCIKDKDIKSIDCVKYDTVGTYIRLIDEEKFSVKPYLRPMSSMTSKEWVEFCDCSLKDETSWVITSSRQKFIPVQNREDYLNYKHFDYRGLIQKGLALEAPFGMYK